MRIFNICKLKLHTLKTIFYLLAKDTYELEDSHKVHGSVFLREWQGQRGGKK